MALSVSAFPEHIQARHNELLATGDDGNTRNPVTAPRIRGFFGGVSSGPGNKKPDLQSSPTTRDNDLDALNSPDPNSTPIPYSPTFQLSPPLEYEHTPELDLQGGAPWAPNPPRRHQPSPFTRKTTPSPIRLGASPVSNRLEIGVAARHVPSKSTPPLVYPAQQWSSAEALSSGQALSCSRPLPVPSELFKPGPVSLPSSPGPPVSLKPASSIILPSRSASATGSSKHTNPLPTPPTYPSNIVGPSRQSGSTSWTASPPNTASPVTPPSSKVLITQPQRGHKPNSTSVSMRYQPLFVDPSSPDTSPTSSSPKQTNDPNIVAPSAVRPLPRVPPSLSSFANFGLPSGNNNSNPTSHVPVRRPRTSPGSFSGFSGLSTTGSSSAIPGSWASKPCSSRPSSPPSNSAGLRTTAAVHPRRPPPLKMPRARSLSRTRRERSFDSYIRVSSRSPPNSAGLTTSFALGGVNRSLTVGRYGSQALTGARPSTKRSNVTPTIMGRQLDRRDSLSARSRSGDSSDTTTDPALGKGSNYQVSLPSTSSLTRNPSQRHVRPHSPPSGPVMRAKSVKVISPTSAVHSLQSNAKFPSQNLLSSGVQRSDGDTANAKTFSPESSTELLHVHPILTSLENDESNRVSTSSIDSPLEFFVDGPETDVSSVNRSPSPIRYALPSTGDSSDWNSTDEEMTDDDLGGVSSSTSNSRGWAAGRRRTQLRSYRMDYRPQMQDRLAHDSDRKQSTEFDFLFPNAVHATIRDLAKPTRALPVPPKFSSKEKGKEGNKKKEKWSFGDFTSIGSSSPSAPGTRASSPERKGRSRQPRRLTEAVSLALGNAHVTTSHSRSRRGSISGLSQPPPFSGLSTARPSGGDVPAEYEVLDIRMPSNKVKHESPNDSNPLSGPLDFRIHKSMSTLRADPDSPDTKRSPDAQESPRGSFASESSHGDVLWVTKEGKRSGLRDATHVESRIVFRSPDDGSGSEDMPFMWLSRDKPSENTAPLVRLLHQESLHGHGNTGDNQRLRGSLSKSPGREAFPSMRSPTVGHAPLSPLSASMKRERKSEEAGRKQRTTSGPSRFNHTGSISVAAPALAAFEGGEVDMDSEVVVIKSRRVVDGGRLWEDGRETEVADIIPKLRSLKTTR